MNVFGLRDKLVNDYSSYIAGFINIRDSRIRAKIDNEISAGLLWPDPLVQLNPFFEPAGWIDELVAEGLLHEECTRVFRAKKEEIDGGSPMRLHRHQVEAIKTAKTGKNYVLTTGTGSGKSLTYIVPIVDHILRNGSGKSIKAIIIYPMNALVNSQYGELEKFLCAGYPDRQGPVTFRKYTGQESDEDRQEIIANPPDIILTNYVMLELLLTRVHERQLIKAARGLRFLVLDELHTYRGRQGADIAMLVRRVRDACEAVELQCIGTSATLAGGGTAEKQNVEVAKVATKLFGSEVTTERVIGETLRRATRELDFNDSSVVKLLTDNLQDPSWTPPTDFEGFISDPLSSWLESTIGIQTEPVTGRLVRTKPKPVSGESGAAKLLSELTGVSMDQCIQAIENSLMVGYKCKNPDTGMPTFAFRLHQFISKGDTAYASMENETDRYLTVEGQQFVPGDRNRLLVPLVFCRECGREYFSVWVETKDDGTYVTARMPDDRVTREVERGIEPAYLHIRSDNPWPTDDNEILACLPEDMLEYHRDGHRIKPSQRKNIPQPVFLSPDGTVGDGILVHVLRSPFRFCLCCGVSYGSRRRSDFGAVGTLGTGGRSTATTVLSLSAIKALRMEETIPANARKLLSFTDNRQDASLQAGHFNDFVEVGLIRAGLAKAVKEAGEEGIQHEELTQRVFNSLDLSFESYATDPTVRFRAEDETKRALREVLGYRLFQDLQRGWRIMQPNLEQCGLLHIDYAPLDEVCAAEDIWKGSHSVLLSASPQTRTIICRVLLDFMRRALAIKVDYLRLEYQDRIRQLSSQRLKWPWAIDENEKLATSSELLPRSRRKSDFRGNVYLSALGSYGQFLRRPGTFPEWSSRLDTENTREMILQILAALQAGGLVEIVRDPSDADDVPAYQLPAASQIWRQGDGTSSAHDPMRTPRVPEGGSRTNPYFVDYYQSLADEAKGIEAREHTAQVQNEDRQEREKLFREGTLPVLFCSPTMELGVDIAELNIVNMRNVPPTPANYAQRSGRAGRSGQPALVYTYCSTGSSHDQYFYKRPELMVSGAVSPPRLDLVNEDLIRSHVQAVWLMEAGISLGSSLKDILDVSGDEPTLEIVASIKEQLGEKRPRERAKRRLQSIFEELKEELNEAFWFSEGWLDDVLTQIPNQFEVACRRWRDLYKAALRQVKEQGRMAVDASRTQRGRDEARRLQREAMTQLDLLIQSGSAVHSDFYSYRYFAGEGFLPGYNFPRLPISAYIPASRRRGKDEFVSRPRFLAISEFGPQSFVYHEGAKYVIQKAILPAREGEEVGTGKAKQCEDCGYLHPVSEGDGPDMCERCSVELTGQPLTHLFRLENVATRRRERINSDEEERQRQGYELKTGFRFAEHGGRPSHRSAGISVDNENFGRMTYGHGARLWRINMGWRRRNNPNVHGFLIDLEKGTWSSEGNITAQNNGDSEVVGPRHERVIPYVEDHKNCLLFEPSADLTPEEMASLQSALKAAVQVIYQLEENEIAVEPMPDRDNRQQLLFYEASEGGAGVLRRLIDEASALSEVAREAQRICHFDPDTGEDLKRAPRATEDCEAACYDCLMNYGNQTDHMLLDRQKIRDFLQKLAKANVEASAAPLPRAEHLQRLMNQAGSDLERRWLAFINEHNYRLPARAQVYFEACRTRPDFTYDGDYQVAVYIDGPPHQYADRKERDHQQTECMEDEGLIVVRFEAEDDWDQIIARYPNVFGKES